MSKLKYNWDTDIYGKEVLRVEKKRGKITLSELEDLLRYEPRGILQGQWVIVLNCIESTCDGTGWHGDEEQGDVVMLREIVDDCPICGKEI